MSTNLALSLAFGISFLACVFLAVTWAKVAFDCKYNEGRKFFVMALGLLIANTGVAIMAFNRTSVALIGREIYPVLLLLAAIIVVIGKITLMTATSLGTDKRVLKTFTLLAAVWTGFVLWWFLI